MKLAKTVRILTVAPLLALVLTSTLHFSGAAFADLPNYLCAVIFLALFPLLAYPLQPFIPKFKGTGRPGQRALAIVMSVAGYILAAASALFLSAGPGTWLVYLTYLFSGALIAVFNRLLGIKASGHACGVVGPLVALWHFFGRLALAGLPLLAAVYWACLKMKRHTAAQLAWGSAIPIAAFCLSKLVLKLV